MKRVKKDLNACLQNWVLCDAGEFSYTKIPEAEHCVFTDSVYPANEIQQYVFSAEFVDVKYMLACLHMSTFSDEDIVNTPFWGLKLLRILIMARI